MDDTPRRQRLSGYVMRDYQHTIATLTAARDSQGVSLRRLSRRTDCTAVTLSANLGGRNRMDAHTLHQLAGALGYAVALIPQRHRGVRPTGTGWPA